MFLKDATLKISGLVARRFLMTLAAVVMFGGVTNADEFLYTVSGVYDAGVDENLPFTAPSGSINYSFILDEEPDDVEPDGEYALWNDVSVSYSLNGMQDDYNVGSLFLENPLTLGAPAKIFLLDVGPSQLNIIDLPSVPLYEFLESEIFLQSGSYDFDGGFLGNSRFRGNVTIRNTASIPEPTTCGILGALGLGTCMLRRRRI